MYKVIVLLVSILISHVAIGANLPDFPFVVSVGKAEQDVKPDLATIRLGVMAFESESDIALKTVNSATTNVINILKDFGIGIEAIKATDIEKSTKRRKDSRYNRLEILGYEVSRSITIELDNLSKYSEMMSSLVAVNNLSRTRTTFDVRNRDEIEAGLIVKASANAKRKATAMAHGLGTKIHSVYAISQASDFGEFFATFGARSNQIMASMMERSRSSQTVMFAPETINISQGINVVFRIKQ